MKKKGVLSTITDSLLIALLVPCVLWCLVSSFDLNANLTAAVMCSAVAALLSSLTFTLVKNAKIAVATFTTAFTVLVLFLLLEFDTLTAQLEYVINRVLFRYSEYLSVPQSISFSSGDEVEATLLINLIEFILIFLFTFCIIKLKTTAPILIISILFLTPCFILLGTMPDLAPLFLSIAAMAVLLVTSGLRRHGTAHCGTISVVSFVLVLCILGTVYAVVPPENFEREPWQDDILLSLRQSLGLEPGNGNNNTGSGSVSSPDVEEIDLSEAGPLNQTHEPVMQVYTDYDRTLYLRGTVYANYDNNKWSTLNQEQINSYPDQRYTSRWTPLYTSSISEADMSMRIVTQDRESILYTPYYLNEAPSGGVLNLDINILNTEGRTFYNIDFNRNPVELSPEVYDVDSRNFSHYLNYVYNYYTQISAELSDELTAAAEQSWLEPPLPSSDGSEVYYYDDGSQYTSSSQHSTQDVVDFVRQVVSSSAEYSLDTEQIPQGEDIASYLLTDMDTGYCVHFATSAAMLLRAYGIPSRYVTGYCADISPDEPYTTISSDNAHAWVEYFEDGVGWVPLDATPASFTPAATYAADPLDEEPQTETHAPTGSTTRPSATEATEETETSAQINPWVILPFAIVVLAAAAVVLRYKALTAINRRRFSSGGKNKRAVYIYRYIERCAKHSKQSVPRYIYDIGAKASFSRHKVSDAELRALWNYAEKSKSELYKDSSAVNRLYYKIIAVL